MPGRLLSFARTGSTSHSEGAPQIKRRKHANPSPAAEISLIPAYNDPASMKHLKRHSLGSRQSSDKSSKAGPPKSAELDFVVESPPLIFYNGPQNSTGALFSGQLKVKVTVDSAAFESIVAKLQCSVTHKKPVSPHCPECATQTTELKKWDILKSPKDLTRGEHSYPVSYLLPGHLPATTHASMVTLEYHLVAEARTASGETLTFKRKLDVKRAIFPSGDRNSTRLFPPTNVVATATMSQVIHPIGSFNVQLRLTGMNEKPANNVQMRWRLRKLNWQIEENLKMVAPACAKHASKVGGEGKGMQYESSRVLASHDIRDGWKNDFSEGSVELEFPIHLNANMNPVCDVEAANGLEVVHNLVVEMIVAQEWAPLARLESATPTGAARVLRIQFRQILTERTGLGIAWDEEQPPIYEDVPASPPNYASLEEFQFTDLDIDRLSLGR